MTYNKATRYFDADGADITHRAIKKILSTHTHSPLNAKFFFYFFLTWPTNSVDIVTAILTFDDKLKILRNFTFTVLLDASSDSE